MAERPCCEGATTLTLSRAARTLLGKRIAIDPHVPPLWNAVLGPIDVARALSRCRDLRQAGRQPDCLPAGVDAYPRAASGHGEPRPDKLSEALRDLRVHRLVRHRADSIFGRAGARKPAALQVLVPDRAERADSARPRVGGALHTSAGCRPALVAIHLPRTSATTKPRYRYREEATCIELGP
jgi:hypothetical protein